MTQQQPVQPGEVAFADRGDVEAYAAHANIGWIECRERGHTWRDKDAARYDEEQGGGYWRVMRCPRCETLRHEELDPRGVLLGTEYEYADGYQLPKGTGRVSADGKGVFRLASIQRQMMRSQANLFKAAS